MFWWRSCRFCLIFGSLSVENFCHVHIMFINTINSHSTCKRFLLILGSSVSQTRLEVWGAARLVATRGANGAEVTIGSAPICRSGVPEQLRNVQIDGWRGPGWLWALQEWSHGQQIGRRTRLRSYGWHEPVRRTETQVFFWSDRRHDVQSQLEPVPMRRHRVQGEHERVAGKQWTQKAAISPFRKVRSNTFSSKNTMLII